MALSVTAPKGMMDLLPEQVGAWQALEKEIRALCAQYGLGEIRTPVVEHTEVFSRSVGDETDVVSKEMYTFLDKGERSITLRPEGTAGVVRAFLEHGLFNAALPVGLFYLINCFRYEKPQKGRLRQFSQFGVEMFGTTDPLADATVISLPNELFRRLGVENLELHINSIGCRSCRAQYRKALVEYFSAKENDLCPTCRERLKTNPMRILDCKDEGCKELSKDAPLILDYICDECSEHFEKVKSYLSSMGIAFTVDPKIVRGLDYYNRTVFEFVTTQIGAQGTVCGGGRYDGLTTQLGGADMPGLGFAMGIERFLLLLEAQGKLPQAEDKPDLYLAPLGEAARAKSAAMLSRLYTDGVKVQTDLVGRSLKAQMKYANKIGAKYIAIFGDEELQNETLTLKNMENGEQQNVAMEDLAAAVKEETK